MTISTLSEPRAVTKACGAEPPAVDADHAEIAWMERLRVEAVLVATVSDAKAACAELAEAEQIEIDIETKRKPGLPPSLKKKDKPELDPYRADIATVQLYAGRNRAFVFADSARDHVLASGWLGQPQLRFCAHNSQFETTFMQHAGVALARPIDCTMHMHKLLFGPPHGLADAWHDIFGDMPPKSQGASDWSGELSESQIAYAAADAVMTWALCEFMLPKLGRRKAAYELAVAAIPEVAAMERRGLGFDPEEHARQLADWKVQREQARIAYRAAMGKP